MPDFSLPERSLQIISGKVRMNPVVLGEIQGHRYELMFILIYIQLDIYS